jgi:arylsulfatase A-like enzyme
LLTKGSNAPLRGFKWRPWEGASRVPCIVRWPGRIPGGRTSDELVAIVDFFPTLLGFAGAAPAAGQVIDGLDLGPFLLGKTDASPRRIHLYGGYGERQVDTLRVGRWKLVRERELYDLGADISENCSETVRSSTCPVPHPTRQRA